MIRLANLADCASLAHIHRAALGDSFLAQLGARYLTEKFYPKSLAYPDAFTLVAEENGAVRAFVTFARSGAAFEHHLARSRSDEVGPILKACLRTPWLLKDIAAMMRGARPELAPEWRTVFQEAELFTIAVDPVGQSRGLGQKLVEHGLTLLRERFGLKGYRCYVKTHSDRAATFYQRCGYRDIGVERRGHTRFRILGIRL